MITGEQHPDYIHRGPIPYVIDGEPELTVEADEPRDPRLFGAMMIMYVFGIICGVAFGISIASWWYGR